MTTASDNYERFTQQVIASLTGVEVHHKRVYVGRVSQRKIKVDVSFNYSVAGANLIFIVECKCYSHSVSVDEVEECRSKLNDMGAHKGIMVTTIGYQEGAVKAAMGWGIALALLTADNQPGELRFRVSSGVHAISMPVTDKFWQGNLRGPLENYVGGFRFEGKGQFLGLLGLDAYQRERQERVAAWEREQRKNQ